MNVPENKVYNGDCMDFMKELPDESVDLIVTDPPYNQGKNYATDIHKIDEKYKDVIIQDEKTFQNSKEFNDNKKFEEYLSWCKKWLKECFRILKKKGALYLFNYPRNNAYLLPYIEKHLYFKGWLTWHYPTNTGHSKYNYTRSQHTIIFATKGKKTSDCIFNKDAVAQPYKNPEDKRIKKRIAEGSNGRAPYDVFQFNLVKNVSREKTIHVCQLPTELVGIFIKASSNEGSIVFDPFLGSGTVAESALNLKRKFSGAELSTKYCEVIRDRIIDKLKQSDITQF